MAYKIKSLKLKKLRLWLNGPIVTGEREDKAESLDVEMDTSCLIWCVCGWGIEDKDGSADVEMVCHVSFGVCV